MASSAPQALETVSPAILPLALRGEAGAAFRHIGTAERTGRAPSLSVNSDTGMREARDFRVTLFENSLVRIENVSMSPGVDLRGVETEFRLVLPYLGLVRYDLGSSASLLDSNSSLWTFPGWTYELSHPAADVGHAAIVVIPSRELLGEICPGRAGPGSLAALAGRRCAPVGLLLMIHRLIHASSAGDDPLATAELTVRLIEAVAAEPVARNSRSGKLVDRAKAVLHARGCDRLSLCELAREIGVTPVYLTQQFTLAEGIPLYRYSLQLRLARALVELPHRDDITGLALDLGFSSHSHFTSVFRRIFGITPSHFRSCVSKSRQQIPADFRRSGRGR